MDVELIPQCVAAGPRPAARRQRRDEPIDATLPPGMIFIGQRAGDHIVRPALHVYLLDISEVNEMPELAPDRRVKSVRAAA